MNDQDHDLLIEIHTTVKSIKQDLPNFVRGEEFYPVRAIVYGLVGIILISVVGALTAVVLR